MFWPSCDSEMTFRCYNTSPIRKYLDVRLKTGVDDAFSMSKVLFLATLWKLMDLTGLLRIAAVSRVVHKYLVTAVP